MKVKSEVRWLVPRELAIAVALALGVRLPRPIPILMRVPRR